MMSVSLKPFFFVFLNIYSFKHTFVLSFSQRMLRPEQIQKDLDEYNRPVQNERSIDDYLDSTDAFVQWAQRKAPQYDPENRRPIPVRIQYSCLAYIFNSTNTFFPNFI